MNTSHPNNVKANIGVEPKDLRNSFKNRANKVFNLLAPFLGVIIIFILFNILTKGAMVKLPAIKQLVNQNFILCMVSVGAAFVYAQGYLDFSLGGVMALTALLGVITANKTQSVLPLILICLVLPFVCSVIVCWLSESLRVEPMLSSLCVLFISQGIVLSITTDGSFTLDKNLRVLSSFPIFVIATAVVIFVCWMIFEHTPLGRNLKAMGGNKLATSLSGVNVKKSKYLAYMIMGLVTGVTAFFMLMRTSTVGSATNSTMHLDIIVTLMLGGMPTKGGTKARIGNAVAGALTMGVLSVGFVILETDIYIIQLIKGLLFLLVIGVGSRTPKSLPRAK